MEEVDESFETRDHGGRVALPVRPAIRRGAHTARYPDVALLFAWNHAKEIKAKESRFREAGGRWLEYVPEVGLQ